MTFHLCLNEKLFCIISPNIRSEVGKQGSAKVYSADLYRNGSYFPKYAQNVTNEHFAMTFRQDCGTFSSFLINLNAHETYYGNKKKNTTPVTTVPELPGLLDKWAL